MTPEGNDHEAPARVVALMAAATGKVAASSLQALKRRQAFASLGIERERFIELANGYAHEMGSHLGETSWLCDGDRAMLDELLHRVTDPAQRRLVCRLVASVIDAGGCVSNQERLLYAHMLASWRMTPTMTADRPAE